MQSKHLFSYIFVLFILIILNSSLYAQIGRKGLIFSEVYFYEQDRNNCWIEIYNPSTSTLYLEKFRFSHVLTNNMLPEDAQKSGGIEIGHGECIILCPNKDNLDAKLPGNTKVIQIEDLSCFGNGGFCSLRTKGLGEAGVDIFRYGAPEKTARHESQIGNFVLPLSKQGECYTRDVQIETDSQIGCQFFVSTSTPGYVK